MHRALIHTSMPPPHKIIHAPQPLATYRTVDPSISQTTNVFLVVQTLPNAFIPLKSYYVDLLIASNCFSTKLFASMNRSTQFCMQGSSYLSSLPDEILEAIHFLKHISVRA